MLGKVGGKKKSRMSGISKLDDANMAGGKNSSDCTLILTEGDSAKALAVSGLGVVGRDKYGVFPLKGKPLNVRDAGHKKLLGNEEITSIMRILGLNVGKTPSVKDLRYGHLMIMTDQVIFIQSFSYFAVRILMDPTSKDSLLTLFIIIGLPY
jgi:DNA topoisomerase-2